MREGFTVGEHTRYHPVTFRKAALVRGENPPHLASVRIYLSLVAILTVAMSVTQMYATPAGKPDHVEAVGQFTNPSPNPEDSLTAPAPSNDETVQEATRKANPDVGIHPLETDEGNTTIPADTFGVERLWDTATTWCDVNPQPGVWEWEHYDAYLRQADSRGVSTLIVVLGFPPPHAVPDSTAREHRNPKQAPWLCGGTSETVTNYPSPSQWRRYTKMMIEHTHVWAETNGSGMRFAWQIWNEPGVRWFKPDTAPAEPLIELSEQVRELVDDKYAGDVLVAPSFVPCSTTTCRQWQNQFVTLTESWERKKNTSLFDAWSAQLYPAGGTVAELKESFHTLWDSVEGFFPKKSLVWVTEVNANVTFNGIPAEPLRAEQQKLFVRYVTNQFDKAGVGKVVWYRWGSQPGEIVFGSEQPGRDNVEAATRTEFAS